MWNLINQFLNDIANGTGVKRESLSFIAELCSGGPTVYPNSAANQVVNAVTAGDGVDLPSGWYDNLGSNHLEYRVIHTDGKKTKIPRVIFSFQHHTLPGNCRFSVQRWVRINDEWPSKLQKASVNFRKAVAKVHGCEALFISSGPSGSGKTAELFSEFDLVHKGTSGRALYSTSL